MRKLMFSLVATLAFGSFAMANTVDVETVEVNCVKNTLSKSLENKKSLFSNNQICLNSAVMAYNNTLASTGSTQSANSAYYSAYFSCMATLAPSIIQK